MRRDDLPTVARLTAELGYPSPEADVCRRYELITDRPDARLLVACLERGPEASLEQRQDIAGWIHVQALYSLESEPRAEIWGLVVAESSRGTGAGRLLVEAAEQWAVKRGFTLMGLRSNVARVEARGFYEHLGYRVVKTQNAFRKNLT